MTSIMFRVGDYIAYPMHGAGRVEAIEKHNEDGSEVEYYCLYFYDEDLKILVPISKALKVGMRYVIDSDQAEAVFRELEQEPCEEDSNWNRRYRANLDKLRTGTPCAIAQVLGALEARNRSRGLSASEKKILLNARRFLIGEMIISGIGDESQINERIDECLASVGEEVIPKANIV